MTELRAMRDADFAWLLNEAPASAGAPNICDGGIAPDAVIAMLRGVAAAMRETLSGEVSWLVVAEDEAVGMIGLTKAADPARPEIGYGIAPAREGRGHATAAVAALLPLARAAGYAALTAETGTDNRASQVVLEKNGFTRSGGRTDPEDGALHCWTIGL